LLVAGISEVCGDYPSLSECVDFLNNQKINGILLGGNFTSQIELSKSQIIINETKKRLVDLIFDYFSEENKNLISVFNQLVIYQRKYLLGFFCENLESYFELVSNEPILKERYSQFFPQLKGQDPLKFKQNLIQIINDELPERIEATIAKDLEIISKSKRNMLIKLMISNPDFSPCGQHLLLKFANYLGIKGDKKMTDCAQAYCDSLIEYKSTFLPGYINLAGIVNKSIHNVLILPGRNDIDFSYFYQGISEEYNQIQRLIKINGIDRITKTWNGLIILGWSGTDLSELPQEYRPRGGRRNVDGTKMQSLTEITYWSEPDLLFINHPPFGFSKKELTGNKEINQSIKIYRNKFRNVKVILCAGDLSEKRFTYFDPEKNFETNKRDLSDMISLDIRFLNEKKKGGIFLNETCYIVNPGRFGKSANSLVQGPNLNGTHNAAVMINPDFHNYIIIDYDTYKCELRTILFVKHISKEEAYIVEKQDIFNNRIISHKIGELTKNISTYL